MAYSPTVWKNRVVEKPNTFTMVQNGDGTYTFTPYTGTVTETGTPASASNMNKIEAELVSLDDNKLDSTSYTKEDVLAKLLLADGVGSGLDTDKFQGKDLTDLILQSALSGNASGEDFLKIPVMQSDNSIKTYVFKHGSSTATKSTTTTVTFTTPFTNACIFPFIQIGTGGANIPLSVQFMSKTQLAVLNLETYDRNFYWLALGY